MHYLGFLTRTSSKSLLSAIETQEIRMRSFAKSGSG
jgi:hypothetical protein